MMSRQLTWYSNLTSEEVTVDTRDEEPFVVCSDKVQFIDPPCRLNLLPIDKGSFLPPRKIKPTRSSQDKPSQGCLRTFKTLHKRIVDKPSFKRLISINLTHKINLQSFERLKLVVETLLLWGRCYRTVCRKG
jgi:hypothetical protein